MLFIAMDSNGIIYKENISYSSAWKWENIYG